MNSPASLKMNAVAAGDTLVLQFSWQDHLHVSESTFLRNIKIHFIARAHHLNTPTRQKPFVTGTPKV